MPSQADNAAWVYLVQRHPGPVKDGDWVATECKTLAEAEAEQERRREAGEPVHPTIVTVPA